jgi:hypothetical protein
MNAVFLPVHMLSLCGCYLHPSIIEDSNLTITGGYLIKHPVERAQAIEYLHYATKEWQWRTGSLIKTLKEQWEELDELHAI